MKSDKIKRKLFWITLLFLIVIGLLIASGIIVSVQIRRMLEESEYQQIQQTDTMIRNLNISRGFLISVTSLMIVFLLMEYRVIYKNQKNLVRLAYYDDLTKALNLKGFYKEFMRKSASSAYSIVVMNIKKFQFINNIFGSDQADRLLCQIKEVIENHLNGRGFFCRSGADDFMIYLPMTDSRAIEVFLSLVMEEINEVFQSDRNDYRLSFYFGVATNHFKEPLNQMISYAQFASESARNRPLNNICFYDRETYEKDRLTNFIETHMQSALKHREFKLFLQPKINLKEGTLGGAEALVRWVTEDQKVIFPNDFIPLFEKNGFCVQLDLYMFENVCRQIREWMDQGIALIPISVNQSKLLFFESDYVEKLKEIVWKYQVDPQWITLEILEGVAVDHLEELNEKIDLLRSFGFKISMDDFGSGYSSLNTLGELNIDELKFDRAFLMESSSAHWHRHQLLMEGIVKVTKKLKITTVVEGVETKENEDLVKALDCDYGQGYLYSRPISNFDFNQKYMLLRKNK